MTGHSGVRPARMHADEVAVDDTLVRTLVNEQFPAHAGLTLHRVASTGTDNAIYRLGEHLGVRLPRIGWAVPQIRKEHSWLGRLSPHLPVSVPEPVAVGEPAATYPYPWLIYRWVPGDDALAVAVDWVRLAEQVAGFVSALQAVDPRGGPPAGPRSGPLAARDEATREAIARLDGQIDTGRALAVWREAVEAEAWASGPVWVHADLLPGNVVVRDGALVGVIDWAAAGVGDPACDTMLAWAMPPAARAGYRAAMGVDDATWARGRAWVIEQAVHFIPYYARTIPAGVAAALRRLEAVLADD